MTDVIYEIYFMLLNTIAQDLFLALNIHATFTVCQSTVLLKYEIVRVEESFEEGHT